MSTTNGCCGQCGNSTEDCSCPVGERGSKIRFGTGVPVVLSTDLAGDVYIQNDTTPAGEVWSFNGTTWTDLGYSLQGATGATGAAGSNILYNNHTATSTTAAIVTDLMSFTLPANTMTTDGDEIWIDAYFDTTTVSNNLKKVFINFNGSTSEAWLDAMTLKKSRLQFIITRVSATSVKLHKVSNRNGSTGVVNSSLDQYVDSAVAVADLTITTMPIKAQAQSSAFAEQMNCRYLTVTYKHKS